MDVRELIDRTREAYRTARLYTDRGTRVYEMGETRSVIEFQTTFERPDTLSFAFTHTTATDREPFVFSDGLDVAPGRFVAPTRAPHLTSLGRAVAALTGISFGAAHVIPRLLMPDVISGRTIFDAASDEVLLPDEVIDDERLHVIEMKRNGLITRVLISAATNVIRAIEETEPADAPAETRVLSTFDYRAVLTL